MKKIYTILSIIISMMSMATLTGCSEDVLIAQDLRGVWRGELSQDYYDHRWGHVTEYTEVEYEFYDDAFSMRKGSGVEYSYDRRGRGSACGFDYEVRNGNIYLYFDDGADIVITDYRLNERIFSGFFQDAHTGEDIARFSLVRVHSYYSNDIYWIKKSEGRKADHEKKSVTHQKIEKVETCVSDDNKVLIVK